MNCKLKNMFSGMTILELLVAVSLLIVFTGVVVAVMEASLRFVGEAECAEDASASRVCNDVTTSDVVDGASIDRVRIQSLFDQMEEVLIQPGVNLVQINNISSPLADSPDFSKCIVPPVPTNPGSYKWRNSDISNLPELVDFPLGYRLCLWSTALKESSMECLLTLQPSPPCTKPVSPGVYVLQALPYKLSSSTLPVRRLFCRPRPFC